MRKTPIRHIVKTHKKNNKVVRSYVRGKGSKNIKIACPNLSKSILPSERDIIEIADHLEANKKSVTVIEVINVLRNQGWHVTQSISYFDKLRDKVRLTLQELEKERQEDELGEDPYGIESEGMSDEERFGQGFTVGDEVPYR